MPVGKDEVQENKDEDFVISKVSSVNQDDSANKAWMMTAKFLFPRNFAVQVYTIETYVNSLQI